MSAAVVARECHFVARARLPTRKRHWTTLKSTGRLAQRTSSVSNRSLALTRSLAQCKSLDLRAMQSRTRSASFIFLPAQCSWPPPTSSRPPARPLAPARPRPLGASWACQAAGQSKRASERTRKRQRERSLASSLALGQLGQLAAAATATLTSGARPAPFIRAPAAGRSIIGPRTTTINLIRFGGPANNCFGRPSLAVVGRVIT